MKFSSSRAVLTALLASGAFSAPASLQTRQDGITDLDVLQFALTVSPFKKQLVMIRRTNLS